METRKVTRLTLQTVEPQRASIEQSGLNKYVRRNIYRWHRIISLITIVPVIFWCISGIVHPFMSHWFKPRLAHEFIKPDVVNKARLTLSLQTVLARHNVPGLRTFRIVSIAGQTYYQVKGVNNQLTYYDTQTGRLLPYGDRRYAESLARYFVGDTGTTIHVELITAFSSEYRYVNRLLPVWKVSFDRPDQMDVYVETEQSRLANYNERSRKAFLWVFNNFHSWLWLEQISNNTVRIGIMLTLLAIIVLSTVSGLVIYGIGWKRFKKPRYAGDHMGFLRKYHRQIGLAVCFVTLMFAFSGAYQATRKLTPDERIRYIHQPVVNAADLAVPLSTLPLDWARVTNISLTRTNGSLYYQIFTKKGDGVGWDQRQIERAETTTSIVATALTAGITYYNAQTATLWPDGVTEHAKHLVRTFWAAQELGGGQACCERIVNEQMAAAGEMPDLLNTTVLTRFDREYGFINKRLPVVKLTLDTPDHLTYYVEPATSRLAAQITDSDRWAGLSFSMLHKFSLIDWAGKDFRDAVTILSALGILVVSVLGLILFLKVN